MIGAEMGSRQGGIAVTAEVRWFFHGPCPARIEQWFEQGRALTTETRDDSYVALRGVTSVGIKLRGRAAEDEVRLEVKARHGQPEPLRPAQGVVGLAAAWSKWTLVVNRSDAIASGLEPPIPLIITHKRRSLRHFVHDGRGVTEMPASTNVEVGCDAELSEVALAEYPDRPWWSLAFEAFGTKPEAWAALRATVPHFFGTSDAPPLGPGQAFEERSSKAYPAWLAALP